MSEDTSQALEPISHPGDVEELVCRSRERSGVEASMLAFTVDGNCSVLVWGEVFVTD